MDGTRGAALILEIIIYLVIVALIAVAVISGVRAIRDLVFTSHAKGDIQNIQTWAEGKYSQDGIYPSGTLDSYTPGVPAYTVTDYPTPGYNTTYSAVPPIGYADSPTLTTANNVKNTATITSTNGAASGYCIRVTSASISTPGKSKFWIASNNPSKIMQLGTATHPGGATATVAPTSAQTGVTASCPA